MRVIRWSVAVLSVFSFTVGVTTSAQEVAEMIPAPDREDQGSWT